MAVNFSKADVMKVLEEKRKEKVDYKTRTYFPLERRESSGAKSVKAS